MINDSEIDTILSVIENPIRRKIIKRLSQEPSYPLELAKELGIGQQLVTIHLGVLERNGILESNVIQSPIGPSRRLYNLKKSVCLTVDFGTNLYNEKNVNFDKLPQEVSDDAENFIHQLEALNYNKTEHLQGFHDLIMEIDSKLEGLEAEKSTLLHIRNLVMKKASQIMDDEDKTHDQKRVLHFIVDHGNSNVEKISLALNMHESIVREILESIKKELEP